MTASDQSLHDLIAQYLAANDIELPVFNPVALRLQRALQNEATEIADIEKMIVEDQSLASQILRVANAAFYKGLQQITTIRKALIRLGIEQVAHLASVVALQQLQHKSRDEFLRYQEQLWRHAFASAMGCKWIAERCGYRSEAENAFMAGLLHNIGQLALLKIIEDLRAAGTIRADLPESLIVEILDSDLHTGQGYLLAKQWNLPDEYCVVARDHHREITDASDSLLLFVRLNDQACEKVGIGLRGDPTIALAATAEARALGLSEVALAELEIMLEDCVAIAGQL
jgi:HD-like signal output (HDOD) protein